MKKTPEQIAEQITSLVNELVEMTGGKVSIKVESKNTSFSTIAKGASGALKILEEEGFFDDPKDISNIMEKLKELGRYYSIPSISMNLLNLTKRRIFSRIKDAETGNWLYVIRK
jgi:hypothetical protein